MGNNLKPLTKYGTFESVRPFCCIEEFIYDVTMVTSKWDYSSDISARPWFRGQSDNYPLIPSLFRKEYNNKAGKFNEFQLITAFRNQAPLWSSTPPRDKHLDQWLFLARHSGLPTRLLDWTEGALMALFFAVYNANSKSTPVVWLLHPIKLNLMTYYIEVINLDPFERFGLIPVKIEKRISIGELSYKKASNLMAKSYQYIQLKNLPNAKYTLKRLEEFPNTWAPGKIAADNINLAFVPNDLDIKPSFLPIALKPSYIHPRLGAQKSCFTIHGQLVNDMESFFLDTELVKKNYFKKYYIDPHSIGFIMEQLKNLGITYSSLFPDLDGLAKDITERYFKDDSEA